MSDSSTSLIGESILCHENLKLRRRIAELEARLAEAREAAKPFADIPVHGVHGGPMTLLVAIYEDGTSPNRSYVGPEKLDALVEALAGEEE